MNKNIRYSIYIIFFDIQIGLAVDCGIDHLIRSNPPLARDPLPPQISGHTDSSANPRRRDVGAEPTPERGADGDDAGRREGAARRRHPRPRAPQEEVGRAHRPVPRHPQEYRRRQGVHGRGHARLLLLPRRGQVRRRRRRPPRRPPVRPLRIPPRPLPPGERRRGQAPQIHPLPRPRRRLHGPLQRVPEPHWARPRRPAGRRLPCCARQGHRGARGARLAPDLLPYARRGHQDHQPPRQRAGERREAEAGEHHQLHQGGAGRARARGLLQAQEGPGLQEEGDRAADGRGQAIRGGAACGGGRAQEGHLGGGRDQPAGCRRREGRRHHLLIIFGHPHPVIQSETNQQITVLQHGTVHAHATPPHVFLHNKYLKCCNWKHQFVLV